MRRPASVPTATTSGIEAVSAARVASFRRGLLEWGEDNRRDFPWRRTSHPWRVLVSEVMLQQTQAERVVEPYRRFVRNFPTAAKCAAAPASQVVRLWAGLGYNRRALNLHRSAQIIETSHGGQVPQHDDELRALPGIGHYTARAVRTFAFGQHVAAIDTNGLRVLTRCVQGAPLGLREAQTLGDRLVPAERIWDFNQAMFDLGATVCRSRPDCDRCPLRRQCRWRRSGSTAPDPWRASPSVRTQSPFEGSERQGRGRLLEALRSGPVERNTLAARSGWPGQRARANRVAAALVAEGFAEWVVDASGTTLCLCNGERPGPTSRSKSRRSGG